MEDIEYPCIIGQDELETDEKLLIDFHLGNAINLDLIDFVVNGKNPGYNLFCPGYIKRDYRALLGICPKPSTKIIGFLECTSILLSLPSDAMEFSPKIYKIILDIINRGLRKKNISIPISDYSEQLIDHTITVNANYERMFKKLLKGICMLSERLRGGHISVYPEIFMIGNFIKLRLYTGLANFDLYIGRNISSIYTNYNDTLYIGNYDSVLLLMDTIGQRICLDVGCQITRLTHTPGALPQDDLNQIIILGDQVLKAAGNEGYEVIALFEASVVASLLMNHPDKISDNMVFYHNCMEELREICLGKEWGESVYNSWIHMIRSLKYFSPDQVSNIFCLYRIWGHPRVNILEGMEKVYKKGMLKKYTTCSTAKLITCQFKKMFLSAYLSKRHEYPPLTIDTKVCYVLDRLRSGMPIDSHVAGYTIWDYDLVDIDQIWSVPETYDVCHILNDKAVSPNRSEIYKSIQNNQGTITGVNRRGIIRWMEGESVRCQEFLKDVDEHGLDENSLIIGMYEKEREIKVKARMFSLMSEEMRMYFVLTEELIANHILPYFPEITMKDPLHIQLKKIWAVGGKGQNPLNPNINIDFEKWNLNMREEFTSEIFSKMDRMFGYKNLIRRTHSIFQNSYIYASSGTYLPKINDNGLETDPPMAYIGHLGGFEGLRQKGWTLATVCLLSYIADNMGLEMNLLGQGDNQILKLYMPISKWDNLCYTQEAKEREARHLTNEYNSQMQLEFSDAGLPIKVRETWISSRLFMYGKSMYLDGKNLPQWCKKLLRSYAMSNEGTITISGVVGTIATNMSAAAGVSDHPDIMYVLFLIMAEWSLEYMLAYHPFTRKSTVPDSTIKFRIPGFGNGRTIKSPRVNYIKLIVTLLTIPTAAGGSVNIPLTSYIIRGFPDHASEAYSWIKMLGSVSSDLAQMFQNWYSFLKNPTIQADMLIQSPWSLNHLKPPTPGLQSRELVRSWLLSGKFQGNRFLRNMRAINEYFDRKLVCNELLSNPMNPLISYEIYQGFPHSYYDSILRRFEGTRSVKKMAMKEDGVRPIIKRLMSLESEYLGYLIWRQEQMGVILSLCATKHTRESRDLGWGRHIIGLTTPHPMEFLFEKVCDGTNLNCVGQDHIYLRHDNEGNVPPYLGSRVKTKVVSQQDEGARMEPLICTNARIARYINWLGVGDNLKEVVVRSTRTVCDIDIYDCFFDEDPFGEMYSGSIEHRFNPAAASEGCFINYSPQLGSKVFMSSDHMPTYGKGKSNYTLHFQAMYCFLQYVGYHLKICCSKHYHITCKDCVVPVEEDIGDISTEHPGIDRAFSTEIIPTLVDTIGEITKKSVSFLSKQKVTLPGMYYNISLDEKFRRDIYYGVLLLLSVKCAYSLFIRGSRGSEGLGSDDLQSFPRIYAYKIYIDHIIWTTSRILLYMQIVQSDCSLTTDNIPNLKKRLNKILMNSPLSKYKEVASLCLGRNLSKASWIGDRGISYGSYPETTTSFLRMIKHQIIAEIDNINSIDNTYPTKIKIPGLNCSVREHQTMIGYYAASSGCGDCMALPRSEDPDEYKDCRFGHVNKIVRKIGIVNTPLDRAVKLMSIKTRLTAPKKWCVDPFGIEITITTSRRGTSVTSWVKPIINQRNRELRTINLPTSSIYKWIYPMSKILELFKCIVVFGDGTGSTSFVVAHMFPRSTIYPCALIEGKHGIPQDLESLRPGISRRLSNVSGSLQEALPDDLTVPEWKSQFISVLRNMEGPIMVISDIEGVGGSWDVVKNIYDILPPNIHIISKFYGSEFEKFSNYKFPMSSASLFLSPDNNTQYGEFMMYSITENRREKLSIHPPLLEAYQILSQEYNEIDHYKSQILTEGCAKELRTVSLQLSHDHLTSKGLYIVKQALQKGSITALSAAFSFINSRYRFPQDKIRNRDVRNLTDGTLDKIVKGLKILVLSFYSEDTVYQDWFRGLYLSRCEKTNRIKQFPHIKIVPIFNNYDRVNLDRKDIGVSRTLRAFYGYSGNKVTEKEFIVDCLLPAFERDTLRYVAMTRQLNDDIEILSDLSSTTLSIS